MPTPEWLLSHFITTRRAGSVGSGAMNTWLLGLELWDIINSAPWHGPGHLKCATQGTRATMPSSSIHTKHNEECRVGFGSSHMSGSVP